jgi:hypothetical protein
VGAVVVALGAPALGAAVVLAGGADTGCWATDSGVVGPPPLPPQASALDERTSSDSNIAPRRPINRGDKEVPR